MRILVFPHDLGIGGSQINAIEISASLNRNGHDVVVFGTPGALNARISELGLEFIEAPRPSHRPTPAIIRALTRLVAERNIDVLHGYEWPPTLECLIAAHQSAAVAVSTVMLMSVAPFIPTQVPLLVGTKNILNREKQFGRYRTELLEPPVDLDANNPNIDVDVAAFRHHWGLTASSFVVVAVTRLAVELKLEGILAAIEAVGKIAHEIPVQLLIAGDGAARSTVQSAAEAVNAASHREAVILLGEMPDPRPAYAVADVVLGMGGSALRAMSFAKPLIVQGEQGFWELLTPESLPQFLQQGWFGVGDDPRGGPAKLANLLCATYRDPDRRRVLAALGLEIVTERFSLSRAAQIQEDFYQRALDTPLRHHFKENFAAGGRFIAHQVSHRTRHLFGSTPVDDFNARPSCQPPRVRHDEKSEVSR
jgi:glycosyltransferase involved in cell wall biosynthesis